MQTKKMLTGIFFLLMLVAIPFALADEASLESQASAEAQLEAQISEDPGVTPDSPLYGIDKALDRLTLALTFDKAKRAEKSLDIAKERLLEVRAMIEAKKADKAEDAEKEYEKALKKSEESVEEIESSEDAAKVRADMSAMVRLRDESLSHSEKVALVKERILAKLESEGNLTTEQYERLSAIFDRIENKSLQMEAKLDEKRYAAKIKYKILSGKTDDEVDSVESELEVEAGLENKREERLERHLEAAKERLAQARERLENRNLTAQERAELEAHLDAAEDSLVEIEAAIKAGNIEAAEAVAIRIRGFGNEISEAARLIGESKRNSTTNMTFEEAKERLKLRIEERREEHDDWLFEKLRIKFENSTARAEGLRLKLNMTENATLRVGESREIRTEIRDGENRERTRTEEKVRSDGTIETRTRTEIRIDDKDSDEEDSDDEVESETEIEVRV